MGYAFRRLGVRDPRIGLLGAVMGLAGGVYLDRSRFERDIVDNLAFGLILAALMRLGDIYYGITCLTPNAYKLGLTTLSLAAMAAALTREKSSARPAKIPILGTIAILIAFFLVFSSVTTIQISKTTRNTGFTNTYSRSEGLVYIGYLESSSNTIKVVYQDPANVTGSYSITIGPYSRVDSSNVTHTADKVSYIGLPIRKKEHSNFTRVPGEYEFTISFSRNISKPYVGLYGYLAGSKSFTKTISEAKAFNTSFTIRFNLTSADTSILNNMDYIITYIYRGNNAPNIPISITLSRALIAKKDISRSYLLGAIGLLIIAIIDALPLDSSPPRIRRKRRKVRH